MQRRHQFVAGAFLLAAVAAVAWLLSDRGAGGPRITRDYLAEINAPLEDMPDDQRAWPRYRAAIARMGLDLSDWQDLESEPGTPEWSQFVASVERHQESLAEIRKASKLPYLGYRYGYTVDPEFTSAGTSDELEAGTDAGLDAIVLTPHSKLRGACAFLAMDARLATDRSDGARVAEDVIAMASIARHLLEPPFLVSYTINMRLLSSAISEFGAALEADASMFTAEQMSAVLQALTDVTATDLKAAIEYKKTVTDSFEQCYFTDDGDGDGYFYGPRNETWLGSLLSYVGMPLGGRTIRYDMITWREFREKMCELTQVALEELDQPLWTIETFTADRELERLYNDKTWQPVLMNFPLVAPWYYQEQLLQMRIDSLRVAVAVELYRRQHAALPDRLESLVPEFLHSAPLDRHDGQSLRYQIVAGRPMVYAVGRDRIDDLGSPMRMEVRDWHASRWLDNNLGVAHALRGDVILWPPSLAVDPADAGVDADVESDQQADGEPETAVP